MVPIRYSGKRKTVVSPKKRTPTIFTFLPNLKSRNKFRKNAKSLTIHPIQDLNKKHLISLLSTCKLLALATRNTKTFGLPKDKYFMYKRSAQGTEEFSHKVRLQTEQSNDYTTRLIILPFTKMTFLGVLPSSHFSTTSS